MHKIGIKRSRTFPPSLALVMTLLVASAFGLVAAAGERPSIENLAFMAGCWQGDFGSGTTIRETFTSPRGGTILGNGQMISDGATRFFEFVRIVEEADGITYRPYPAGKESVAFSLVEITATEAVFENPEHDDPQRIIYRAVGTGLVARVEKMDGTKARQFEMQAVACGQGR